MKKRVWPGLILGGLVAVGLYAWQAWPGDHEVDQGTSTGGPAAAKEPGSENGPSGAGARPAKVPRFNPLTPRSGRERHFQAIRAKDEARLTGGRVPHSSELFENEDRDPVWAPAMEGRLKERQRKGSEVFAQAGLKDVQMAAPECRTSTCRVVFEYTSETTKVRRPLDLLVQETGPLSTSSSDLYPVPLRVVDGVTHFRKTVYLLFGEEESNPDHYASWAAEFPRRWKENRQRQQTLPTTSQPPRPPELR